LSSASGAAAVAVTVSLLPENIRANSMCYALETALKEMCDLFDSWTAKDV
jgi:hypothetical protein